MTSGGSSSKTGALDKAASESLAVWKSMAMDALEARKETRKKGATAPSGDALDAEAGRLAKSLQRLHPAASESISATVFDGASPTAPSSFARTLRALSTIKSAA